MLRRTLLAGVLAGCAGTVLDPVAPEISVADFSVTGLSPTRQTYPLLTRAPHRGG
jgi:hypothetical protein